LKAKSRARSGESFSAETPDNDDQVKQLQNNCCQHSRWPGHLDKYRSLGLEGALQHLPQEILANAEIEDGFLLLL